MEVRTYRQVLELDTKTFIKWLEKYMKIIDIDLENPAFLGVGSKLMGDLSNNYSVLTSLWSYSIDLKRYYKNQGMKEQYEEMVDKEKILDRIMKSVDMQYKSVSKALTIKNDERKELFLRNSIA